jgi:hypothetical protein
VVVVVLVVLVLVVLVVLLLVLLLRLVLAVTHHHCACSCCTAGLLVLHGEQLFQQPLSLIGRVLDLLGRAPSAGASACTACRDDRRAAGCAPAS